MPAMRALALLLVAGCGPAITWDPAHPAPGGPPPPPLRSPADNAISDGARPRFRWWLPRGEDRAMLELCSDRWCRETIVELEVRGDRHLPASDLRAGDLWWRVRGFSGATMGPWGEPRKLSIETKVGLGGKRVDVILPPDQRAEGQRLMALAERAIDLDTAMLGAGQPEQKSRLYLYATEAGFLRASQVYARFRFKHHLGFSGVWGSHARMWPTVDGGALDAFGDTEWVVLHELAHALQYKTVRLYRDQPAWWLEGLADLQSERSQIGDRDGAQLLPRAASYYRIVRQLGERGKLLPLAKLFAQPVEATRADDDDLRRAMYAEAFTLLDYLDSGERRPRFRALVQEIEAMRGFLVAQRVNQRVLESFGPVDRLEAAWRAWVRERPIFPFVPARGGLRSLAGGGFVVEARPKHLALARFEGGPEGEAVALGPDQRIELEYEPRDTLGAAIQVGAQHGEPWFVTIGRRVTVLSLSGNDAEQHQSAELPPATAAPGTHRAAVFRDGELLVVTVDGTEVLRAPGVPFGGTWGAGCFGGQVLIRSLRAVAGAPAQAASGPPGDPGLPTP